MPSNSIVDDLRGFGDRVAVVTPGDGDITYAQLAERVDGFAAQLGDVRRLVAVVARNDVDSLVAYLGALRAGCVVLLTGDLSGDVRATYDPDVIVEFGRVVFARPDAKHDLHPELALLLSTSGSTGSPKLVRLSHGNLVANAESIAEYLSLTADDRAATTLPLFYCYGLSVVHSHLLRGASLLLTERSVTEPEFWREFASCAATSFATVPYTIELLDRVDFAAMSLPRLRYVTQAGGRLAPERVREFAELGARAGWQFFVMYGQTEATARMAYLPPELASSHPDCIGVAVPGGRFTLEPVDGGDELVYHGPNVMLGYACAPTDLALGRTVTSLRTGDLGRLTSDGLMQVVGRRSQFAKILGLRIDLAHVESELAAAGYPAACAEDDGRLVAAIVGRPGEVVDALARASGLPRTSLAAIAVDELPRAANGKVDYPAVRSLVVAQDIDRDAADLDAGERIRAIYAEALGLSLARVSGEASFVDLGGTSLTYVTTAARLERVIGRLPTDWPQLSVRQLQQSPRSRSMFGRALDTSTALRAIGIVLIVGSHIQLWELWGSAHVLLAVAGYNFARFAVMDAPPARRLRATLTAVAAIAVPTVAWVAIVMAWQPDYYSWQNLLLLNKILGPNNDTAGHLWFLEVLVYFILGAALLLRIPMVARWERRAPFGIAFTVLVFTLALRWETFDMYPGKQATFSPMAAWFFALGWAGAKATNLWQRLLVSAVVLASVPGYFGVTDRERMVMVGLLLLVWLPALRVPGVLALVAVAVADSSMYVYLLHWQVYPLFGEHQRAALIACLLVGIAATQATVLLRRRSPWLMVQGQHLSRCLVRQFGDQQVARNGLTSKVIE
ncbi:AMP-binding protein [Nocardia camponoti]|uniref:AMP-dependent synthetase n=1 Tax=Nocardia camponoti TaxID=1616106 RepID=A0A917Q9Q4_9NOCA|nr:AMP-binding protein [Nocardia camponoti]GGK37782.1 AMP-dependent synthetase [Nocardia camponoti]